MPYGICSILTSKVQKFSIPKSQELRTEGFSYLLLCKTTPKLSNLKQQLFHYLSYFWDQLFLLGVSPKIAVRY
jgi:hypothetical protein